jgi:LysM repeat protein
MAGKVSKPVSGVVKVNPGNTLSQIAKANKLTTKQVLDLNPALKSNPKYDGGNTIFSGTKVRVAAKETSIKKEPPLTTSTTPAAPSAPKFEPFYLGGTLIVPPGSENTQVDPTPQGAFLLAGASPGSSAGSSPTPPVKTAPIDTVLFNDDELPIEVMTDLIFENIGGQELINIARNDIVNGQQVSYQPIKNLSSIQQQYNPNNILALQSTSDKYFANFPIKLENKIPTPGTGPNGKHVYIDSTNGNLIIEAINIESDEQIEVEITVSGTIYEAEFGEITS